MTYTPPGVEPSRPTAPAPAPKTSGHAIAGLLVGLAGLCTCGVGGIAGLVLSIVALKKIDASRGTLGGRGLAIAGIIASAVCILVGLVIGLIFLGFFFYTTARLDAHHARPKRDLDANPSWSIPAPSPGALLPPSVALILQRYLNAAGHGSGPPWHGHKPCRGRRPEPYPGQGGRTPLAGQARRGLTAAREIAESAEITSSSTTPAHRGTVRRPACGALAVPSAGQAPRRTHAPNFTPSPYSFCPFDSRSLRSRRSLR